MGWLPGENRRFCGLVLMLASVAGVEPAAAQGAREYLYLTNWDSHDVSGYVKDPATGALTPVAGSPFATGGRQPRSIAVDPLNRFVFVGNDSSPDLTVFRIDAATGSLTPVPGSPFFYLGDMSGLVVDRTGRFLYVADPAVGRVRGFTIDAATGAVTPFPGNGVPVPDTGCAAVLTPSGRFLYVSTRDPTSEIHGFSVDAASGLLTPLASSPWLVAQGAQAFDMVVAPSGRFLYTAGLESSRIYGYAIDDSTGALSPLPGLPVPTGSYPQHMDQTPDGAFIYTSATSGGTVSGYSVDPETGVLTPLPGFPYATGPISMDILVDASGQLVYVVRQSSSTVLGFRLDSTTGSFSPLASAPPATGAGPNRMGATAFVRTSPADLSIAKTDGITTAIPGTPVAYAITVANGGPTPVTSLTVADHLSADLTSVSFTPSAGAYDPGTGAWTGLSLAPGQSATLTVGATIDAWAVGTLVNTATVAPPIGVFDPDFTNNTATDSDVLTRVADLRISNSDGEVRVTPGQALTYAITAANAGPSTAVNAVVTDAFPPALTGVTWTCTPAGGASCPAPSGTGPIGHTVVLAPGASTTFTAQATVAPGVTGSFTNTATVATPAGVTDPLAANDSASDLDNVTLDIGELSHGYDQQRSLAAGPSGEPRVDLFWIAQKPYSSYEVTVDATSGDIGDGVGPVLERLAVDGSSVLQASAPAGMGASRSLRWTNRSSETVTSELVRIRSGWCSSDCGPDDVYQLRVRETTYAATRFNDTGSQASVVIVQSVAAAPIALTAYFWGGNGALLASAPFEVAPRATLVVPVRHVPGAAGGSGSVTVAHDGRFGDLVGKIVSLDPSNGLTFDTPLVSRAR